MTLISRLEQAEAGEVWKIAAGTDQQYLVSNLGNVKRHDGLLLKQSVPRSSREYPCVMLRHSGQRRKATVHRLVALNFIGLPPFPGAEVRHLDGDNTNPHSTNLAWGSRKDNANDKELHGRTPRGEKHGLSKISDKAVLNIRNSAERTADLAVRYGVNKTTIQRIRNGKRGSVIASLKAAGYE